MRARSSRGAEGLGEVVVGAELEAHDAVGFLAAARQHDDGNLRIVPQAPGERHAVLAAQLEVENHEVHHLLGEHHLHRAAVGDRRDFQLVLAEIVGNELPDHRIVVDDQHMRHCGMRGSLPLRSHGRIHACEV